MSLFAALHELDAQILFCYPNSDAGSYSLMERTKSLSRQHARTRRSL